MSREQLAALALGQIAADAGRQRGALDEARDLLVVEPLCANGLSLTRHTAEQRAVGNTRKLQPGLKRHDGAGRIG